jgi:hypothetical protein
VVGDDGLTLRSPLVPTLPTPPSIETEVAFSARQLSVADCPRLIALGEAVSEIVGRAGGALAAGGGGGGGGGGVTGFFLQPLLVSAKPAAKSIMAPRVDSDRRMMGSP